MELSGSEEEDTQYLLTSTHTLNCVVCAHMENINLLCWGEWLLVVRLKFFNMFRSYCSCMFSHSPGMKNVSQVEVRRRYIIIRFHMDSLNLLTWGSTPLHIHGKDERADDGNKDLLSDEREKQFTQVLQVIFVSQ